MPETIPKHIIKCKYWIDLSFAHAGRCSLGLYGGRPSFGTCLRCEKYDGPARGLGDYIAKITSAVGVKPCGECKERQKKWNKKFPTTKPLAP